MKKFNTKERRAAAMLLDGEYLPQYGMIMVTHAAKPTIWYCAETLKILTEDQARSRMGKRLRRKAVNRKLAL